MRSRRTVIGVNCVVSGGGWSQFSVHGCDQVGSVQCAFVINPERLQIDPDHSFQILICFLCLVSIVTYIVYFNESFR